MANNAPEKCSACGGNKFTLTETKHQQTYTCDRCGHQHVYGGENSGGND